MNAQNHGDTSGWAEVIQTSHSLPDSYSQVRQIIREICASVNDPRHANAIDDLIGEVRLTFHRGRPGDQLAQPVDFTESPSEFLELISDAPENLQNEIISAYETIWLHEAPETFFLYGEKTSMIGKRYLDYQIDRIEYVAEMYLNLPGAKSPTLEWAIVNSLLYAETLAFTQTVAPMRQILAGARSEKGLALWKLMLTSVGSWFWEGIKLLVTAGLAFWVGQGDHTASVILFLAVTAARWFIPTAKQRRDEKLGTLLQAMAGVHHLARRRTFNARVVRHQAYHATTLGACFSDYVFEILDRQISRATR